MRVGAQAQINALSDPNLAKILRSLTNIIDGQLSFGDNIQGKIVRQVYFHAANFNIPIDHDLGRLTLDYVTLNTSGYCQFRLGRADHTANRIYIQCDTAGILADFLILG